METNIAKKLIKKSKDGFDAVKFQKRDLGRIFKEYLDSYEDPWQTQEIKKEA